MALRTMAQAPKLQLYREEKPEEMLTQTSPADRRQPRPGVGIVGALALLILLTGCGKAVELPLDVPNQHSSVKAAVFGGTDMGAMAATRICWANPWKRKGGDGINLALRGAHVRPVRMEDAPSSGRDLPRWREDSRVCGGQDPRC